MGRATRAAWAAHRADGSPRAVRQPARPADADSPHVDPDVPWETRRRVYQAILMGVRGQGILRGERLPDLVKRVCPNVLSAFALEGLRVNLDLPENTHEALRGANVVAEIRRLRA